MKIFGDCLWIGSDQEDRSEILTKISYKYETWQVIPYIKNIQKMYKSRDTQFSSSTYISIFSKRIRNFCYINNYRYRLHFYV